MIPTSRPSLAADLKFLTRAIFAPVRTFEESLLFLRTTILLFFILVPVADVLGAQSYGYHGFKLYGDFIGYSVLSFATYRYRSMLFAILLILAEVTDLYLMSQKMKIGLVSWPFLIPCYLLLRILYLTYRYRILSASH